jgi:hypothetical protein
MADNTQAAHIHFRSSPRSKARLPLSTLDKHCATDFDDFEANKRPNTPLIHSLPIHWEWQNRMGVHRRLTGHE